MCKHHNFIANVSVGRITETEEEETNPEADIKVYMAEVVVKCVDCGIEMQFLGVEGGMNFNYPTTNFDASKIHLPMRPSNKPREFYDLVN